MELEAEDDKLREARDGALGTYKTKCLPSKGSLVEELNYTFEVLRKRELEAAHKIGALKFEAALAESDAKHKRATTSMFEAEKDRLKKEQALLEEEKKRLDAAILLHQDRQPNLTDEKGVRQAMKELSAKTDEELARMEKQELENEKNSGTAYKELKQALMKEKFDLNKLRAQCPASESMHFIYILDKSGSMGLGSRWAALQESVDASLRVRSAAAETSDKISVVLYDSTARIITRGGNTPKDFIGCLKNERPSNGTDFGPAFERAKEAMDVINHRGKVVVIFMTEGEGRNTAKAAQILKDMYAAKKVHG